jgi:four helix bundle protein
MKNREFGKQLEQRTKEFALTIIKLSASLPNSIESNVIRYQLTKAGTSVGANYREANRARSNADFSNKIKISESEASETCYWLELVDKLDWTNQEKLKNIYTEANELLAIFSSISNTLRTQNS